MRRAGPAGFSLIELLVALAVLAVIAAIGVPSWQGLMRDTRLTSTSNEIFTALFHARSEAIRRGRRATLCTSADGEWCATGVDWHAGWMLFEDGNDNGRRDAGETIVAVSGARSGRLRITGNDPVRNYVSYVPTGMTRTTSGALQMGRFTICHGGRGRQIVISASGRPRVVAGVVCDD
ncbi:GspH/FimT family pseudopilin [Pseudothauera rhizosphaerae]|uniref:Type II secretion system protein H n=1 Tax=Pseudothauera rhizosphaerae TaxID=2565932 RepID=A0A4S4AW17_9RHOO|nr:GspH/FimT family pseudopilin [Pseudothauera rhizosphaerae]THF62776.1 prepilin-type N-terminal cleavage/methylation domain-containing protein [Pseudothauera rhizosphaerae]